MRTQIELGKNYVNVLIKLKLLGAILKAEEGSLDEALMNLNLANEFTGDEDAVK